MEIEPRPLLRAAFLGLFLAAILAGCAGGGGSTAMRDDLGDIFNDARATPSHREGAILACVLTIERQDYDDGFDDMIRGLLDVPKDEAFPAYCAAMVEASIANKMTASDIRRLHTPPSQRGKEPFGHMLRQVLEAHARLRAQQAQLAAQTSLPD
jgi:hypothetical protein